MIYLVGTFCVTCVLLKLKYSELRVCLIIGLQSNNLPHPNLCRSFPCPSYIVPNYHEMCHVMYMYTFCVCDIFMSLILYVQVPLH